MSKLDKVKKISGRQPFATTIDENLQREFKAKCAQMGVRMNDVIEALFNFYINNDYDLALDSNGYELKPKQKK